MVFLIAIVPALFVFVVGAMSASKSKTRAWAIIAALLGIFTGNPAFMAIDLVAVAIAYGLASLAWSKAGTRGPSPQPMPAPQPVTLPPTPPHAPPKSSDSNASVILVISLAALCLFLFYSSGSNQPKTTAYQTPQPVPSSHYKVSKPNEVVKAANTSKPEKPAVRKETPVRKRAVTVVDCLKIVDDQAMVRCMERAK